MIAKLFLWIIIIPTALVIGWAHISGETSAPRQQITTTEATPVDSGAACVAAQRVIRTGLKAPATAKFPGCVLGADQYVISHSSDRRSWIVRGHVDAQNGFGAMIREQWRVELVVENGRFEPVRGALGDRTFSFK